MKKVRFMLLAIAVIAIAAGTLAFKARFQDDICTAPAFTRTSDNVKTCFLTNAHGLITSKAICDVIVTDRRLITPHNPQAEALCYTLLINDECEDTDNCAKATMNVEGGE